MITHLEPDILECEVKRALESITMNKASGGDGIQLSCFKSWKTMLGKCCTQYASKFGKLSSGHRIGKGQFSSKERQCQRMLKLPHNCTHLSRQWHPTPVLLLGKSHGWRSLEGCSPRGPKESDMTERLNFHFLFTFVYSCHLLLLSSASVKSIPFLCFIEPIFA